MIFDNGDVILNSSAYNIVNKGTIEAHQTGVLGGFYNCDGTFKGKITINSNYKLFRLQELSSSGKFSLISVHLDTMQELTEGQYIVVRTDVYESVKDLNNETGNLFEAIKNLMPHDSGKGDGTMVNANSTAVYVFTIQFEIASIKNS